MDIWAWVHEKEDSLREAGEHRLADIIDEMPSYCCDEQHSKVYALYKEGVALAQRLEEPWVEVFVRHWFLQSQVLKQCNAKDMLTEAVELLDLSHSDKAKGCPQRICAVQDLSNCYGVADGPGFVNERLAVSSETLAEIDSSWPCFICIGSEYLDALYDAERYEEVITECKRLQLELARNDKRDEKTVNYIDHCEAYALIRLGQPEIAAESLKSKRISSVDGSGGRSTKLLISLALAHAKRFDDLPNVMLSNEQVFNSHRYFNDWGEIQQILVRNNQIEFDDKLAHDLLTTANMLLENGSYRNASKQLMLVVELGFQSGFLFCAKVALAKLPNVISSLNKDLGAAEELNKLILQFEANRESNIETFDNYDDLSEFKFESKDAFAQALELYCDQNSEDVEALVHLASTFADYTDVDSGYDLLFSKYNLEPENVDLHYAYAKFVLEHHGKAVFVNTFQSQLSQTTDKLLLQNLWWLFAVAYRDTGPAESIKYFEKYLAENKDHVGALSNLAWLYSDNENYDRSVSLWNTLIDLDPDDSSYSWYRLLPATLQEDWNTVKDSSDRVGIEFDVDNPLSLEGWGGCRVRFEGDGEIYFAKRTGPVTAEVRGINNIDLSQRYGQSVVFDPSPLNTLDQEDEDGNSCDTDGHYNYLFSVYKVVNSQSYLCFDIDGVMPCDDLYKKLVSELSDANFVFDKRSSEEYLIEFSDDKGGSNELHGLYAYVLIPEKGKMKELHEILLKFNQQLEHPIIWPKLAESLELNDVLLMQSEIEEKYNL